MSLEMPSMHKVLLFGSWQRHALQTSMLKRSSILVSKGGGMQALFSSANHVSSCHAYWQATHVDGGGVR